jgi:hypothetical protein
MKVAVMQPYFFPYSGYFELIKSVDHFVIFDDVNYIKGGWINKNRILQNGHIMNITLPVQKASQNKKINELSCTTDPKAFDKIKKQVQQAYCKAPNFDFIFPIICELINYPEKNLAQFLAYSLIKLSSHMGFNTRFIFSSELSSHDEWDNAENRIIDLTKKLGGTQYYNLPGGKSLYNAKNFAKQNIELKFITPKLKNYTQLNVNTFIPSLSIIDFLMYSGQKNKFRA